MSALSDRPIEATCIKGLVRVRLASGKELTFSINGNPRLEGKTDAQLNHIELSPLGLHWPDLDEDLSLAGIAEGRYGQVIGSEPPQVAGALPSINQLKRAVAVREQIAKLEEELAEILGGKSSSLKSSAKQKFVIRHFPKSIASMAAKTLGSYPKTKIAASLAGRVLSQSKQRASKTDK